MIRSRAKRALLNVIMCLIAFARLSAHEPGQGHSHSHATKQGAPLPKAMVLPALEGSKPWSNKPILDDPERFNIAIMTDHTGGHRPGIWMKAVRRLNLLRPTFVMSIGDLIEGWDEDRDVIETQWKEFLGFIDEMQMRFFFVAGNHDLKNPLMHTIWREHFGVEWYSFDYKGVHFVCLNSEDPVTIINDKQLSWIEDDLAKHRDARWTLVFLHKPLWVVAEEAIKKGQPDPTNWKKVEKMLGTRKHTVFAGHVHHYVQYDRNGMKYYHLATTGGSSPLRGIPYGEFDHVTWLTMENDGPYVTHLLLDGILPPDAVTETGIARFHDFLEKTRIEVAPILIDREDGFSSGRIDIRMTNGFTTRVDVSGKIDGLPLRSLTVDPESLHLSAEPGQTVELALNIRFGEKISFNHLAETLLHLKMKSADADMPLEADRTIPVVIDQSYPCPLAPANVLIDGNLDEWSELTLKTGAKPLVLGPTSDWQGPSDASIEFTLAHDARFVYCAGNVTDDTVIVDDSLELRFDPRPLETRKTNPKLGKGTYKFQLGSLQSGATPELKVTGTPAISGSVFATRRNDKGYSFEIAIPIESLTKGQTANWKGFQFTPVINDVDQAGEKPCRIIWRGSSDIDSRNTNFGQIVRKK